MDKEKIQTAQWVFERQLSWISSSEVKAGVITTIDIAMAGALAACFTSSPTRDAWAWLSSVTAAALLISAIFCTAMAIIPRLDGPDKSLLFFGKIAKLTSADFGEQFRRASYEMLLSDWLDQIHTNSKIATVKHGWIRKSLLFSLASALPWVVAICVLLK